MSDYHILEQDKSKDNIRVVFHFSVPATGTNEAGKLYTEIVKVSEDTNSVLPSLQADFPQEYQDMQDGKRIERDITVKLSTNDLTPAQKKAEIENGNPLYWEGYNSFKTKLFGDLQIEWEWYGFDGDIT